MTARNHRPRFLLFVAGRPPVACCSCHFGQPVRFDRQMGVAK